MRGSRNRGIETKTIWLILIAIFLYSLITDVNILTEVRNNQEIAEENKITYQAEIQSLNVKIQNLKENNLNMKEQIFELSEKATKLATELANLATEKSKSAYTINSIGEMIDASEKFNIGDNVPLPDMPTNVKLCTDYRFYNLLGTPHNRLQSVCWTDEYGCRRYNNDYCVGLGSYYTINIGDRFEVELETGISFTIILGDGKADCDTDSTHRYTPCYNYDNEKAANVLEFIIDENAVSVSMYQYGSVDYYDYFKGNIVRMTYLGRDTSADWDTYE